MNLARSIILVVFTVCALFLGVILIWDFLAEAGLVAMPFDIVETVRTVSSSPWNGRIGLALVAAAAALIVLRTRELRREQCIAFDNPGGEVAISMDAVEDFIRRAGGEFAGVKGLVPRIHAGAEGIGIHVRMDIWEGTNIPRLSEEMQNAIKNRVQDSLGINVASVSVSVGKIVSGGGADETEE
ncbi:MAG: alkaline shock response membrane anchor protein AmaP [bacterium]|nr:alkaline shock response membrane anchor protein AmaP [bacterium]